MSNHEPILSHPPLATSKNENWDGIYLQHERQPAFELPQHTHLQHTLVVSMDDGLRGEWSINGKFRDLQYNRGDLFLIPAGATHKVYWKQESEVVLLTLEPETVFSAVLDSVDIDRWEIIPQFAVPDLRLLKIAQWLLTELYEKPMGSKLYVDSLTNMLMVHLLRNYSVAKPKAGDRLGGLAPYKLQRAISYINENLDRDLRLTEIASLVALSPYHFSRMFKQSMNSTPHQYLVQQRLAKAKELLRYSKITISEIGYLICHKNSSHFARVFRQHTQTTPKAYRNSF